jgi:hypothetical protein
VLGRLLEGSHLLVPLDAIGSQRLEALRATPGVKAGEWNGPAAGVDAVHHRLLGGQLWLAAEGDERLYPRPRSWRSSLAELGLERDLQLALRRSVEQLEPGLTIIDGDREQTVASGRIDITARDKDGTTVVIELKAGAADRDAIGQILSYMGDLMDQDPRVRGIIVASDFTTGAMSAARAAASVRLVRYVYQFTFRTVV